jgi:hypothetical protein
VNAAVTQLLTSKGIKIVHPNSPIKAAVVERFNKSIQGILFRHLTENQTNRYVDDLDDILHTYNSRGHRSIRYMTPNEAELERNWDHVRSAHNERYTKFAKFRKKTPKFKIGDVVRVIKPRRAFGRGYHEQFQREYFEIIAVNHRMPIVMYEIKSLNDGVVKRQKFYEGQLQPTKDDSFKVEKVIKERTRRGRRELLVKWLDWSDRHSSWVPASNVTRVYNNSQ